MSFNDGILTSTTTGTDPRLTLNTDGPIDTSKYRYATFRIKINGPNSAGNGWVQRFVWWYAGPTIDNVTTQDMMLYEGWHTYSIDLKNAGMEICGSSNCWSGNPTGFRFDPVEAPAGTTFSLDFLTLTSVDSINRGDALKVYYTLPNAPDASVMMYLDTDLNPLNGRIVAPQMPSNPIPGENPLSDAFNIFLPVLFRPGGSGGGSVEFDFFDDSLAYLIDTAQMDLNTYYLSADVSDGVMTTTWYSETPVVIK
jgi:hypothetical protein